MTNLLKYCFVLAVASVTPWLGLGAEDKKEEKKGAEVEIDSLKSAVPAEWKQQEVSSQFRIYHFRIPHVADDKTDADLIVFYFGGGGGSADANIKRWKGMFIPPEGKKIDDVAKVENFKVGDVNVTHLDVEGTYRFKERPFDPASKEELRPDHRMLGVVFESPKGPYFIRLVGPAKTVTENKKAFEDWIKGFK